ncbi:sugar phosphate isomerase/epimerase family protein [Paracoccus sediminilitoris]|uniref:sugar phosphate isomerase/epimerase family protein n=1 Tax=Paracoccus sediminilitoris TaxID=2202419 RepID=UPI00272B987A|nr:TIM barrel protein [Paracoccus sediminilitoris]
MARPLAGAQGMRVHACSVALRHDRITAPGLAAQVLDAGFDGLEIWAPHAEALQADWAALARRPVVPMLSGYLPVGTPAFDAQDALRLVGLTTRWQAGRLRLFAGGVGWDAASGDDRAAITRDLRIVADMAQDHGIRIAIETHPGTLADSLPATLALMQGLDHPAVGLNVDILHVWEGGTDPLAALPVLAPHLLHLHLKNVTARDRLSVFAPGNVHDAAGSRDGMCPLFDGVLDYRTILSNVPNDVDMSLEWFGPAPMATMTADLGRIRSLAARRAA